MLHPKPARYRVTYYLLPITVDVDGPDGEIEPKMTQQERERWLDEAAWKQLAPQSAGDALSEAIHDVIVKQIVED